MKGETGYEKGKYDDWDCDKEKAPAGLQYQKWTQRAVTNTPGATVRSDKGIHKGIHVQLRRIYPLLCWTRADKFVALTI